MYDGKDGFRIQIISDYNSSETMGRYSLTIRSTIGEFVNHGFTEHEGSEKKQNFVNRESYEREGSLKSKKEQNFVNHGFNDREGSLNSERERNFVNHRFTRHGGTLNSETEQNIVNHVLNTSITESKGYSTNSENTSKRCVYDNKGFSEFVNIGEDCNNTGNLQHQIKGSDHQKVSLRRPVHDPAHYTRTSTISWFRSFVVLFCSAFSLFTVVGIGASLTAFLPEWLDEFQDGRFQTAAIQSILYGLIFGFGVVTGFIINKFDVRLTMCIGAVMVTAGYLAAVFAPSTIILILTVGLLSGIGSSFIYIGGLVMVSRAFDKHTSIALCVTMASGSFGAIVFPYLLDILLDHYGWRGSFYIIAGATLQTLWLSVLATSLAPATSSKTTTSNISNSQDGGCGQLCQHQYIAICVTAFVSYGIHNGFAVILADYAEVTNCDAVLLLFLIRTFTGLFNIGSGVLNTSRCGNSYVLLALFVLVAGAALLILALIENSVHRLVLIAVLGICKGGAIGMVTLAQLEVVGSENYPQALGIVNTLRGLGTIAIGPVYGLLYDVTKSYDTVFIIIGCVTCVTGVLPILSFAANKLSNLYKIKTAQ